MIDVLGQLFTPGTYDSEGNVITPPEPLPGFHVNAVCTIPAFTPYIITPTTPVRTFGDAAHTVFLRFTDRAEWLSLGIEYTDDEGNQAFDLSSIESHLQIQRHNASQRLARAEAYRTESDPLFFRWQRAEGTEQEWLDAVEAIRARFPYIEGQA